MIDDRQIVDDLKSQTKTKSEYAIARLFNRYKDHLYSYAYQYLKNDHDSQSVVNDTFLAVIEKIDQFEFRKSENDFKNWLLKILANKILDIHRKTQRTEDKIQYIPYEIENKEDKSSIINPEVTKKIIQEYDRESTVNGDSMTLHVNDFINSLPVRDQIILINCVFGMSHEEVAEYAGVEKKHVKVYYFRLKRRLEQYLKDKK